LKTERTAGRWPFGGGCDHEEGVVPCPLEPLPGFGPCGRRLSGGTAVAEPPATFLSPFRAATRRSHAMRRNAVEFRIPEPLGIQSKATVRMDPTITWRERGPLCPPAGHSSGDSRTAGQRTNLDRFGPGSAGRPSLHTVRLGPITGWRGGGPLCPLRWAIVGTPPSRWAENQPGSAQPPSPLGVHPSTPSLGASDRVAGGRTSVSAPLGVCRETTVAMGRGQIGIGSDLRHFDARPSFVVRRPPSSNIDPGHVLKGRVRSQRDRCPSGRRFSDESPVERTQRSGGRGPREYSRESGE
jgi:hypothetical protein